MSGTSKTSRPVKQLRGLQKLRFYCQMCEKQCRDENGFQNHINSDKHIRQMQIFLENPEKQLEEFSKEFEDTYLSFLRRRGDNPVNANNLYQEMIADKTHIHMTATKWDSLTTFVRYLADAGKAEVTIEDGKFFVKYINRDEGFLKRQEIVQKQRLAAEESQKFTERALEEQIARAREEAKLRNEETIEVVPDEVDISSRTNKMSFALGKSSNEASKTNAIKGPPGVVKGPPGILKAPPGVASKAKMGPPGMAAKGVDGEIKSNPFAKSANLNVFAKKQSSSPSTNVFAVTVQKEKLPTQESEEDLKLGQKRPNPTLSSDSRFDWIRKGLVICRRNTEEKFTVQSLSGAEGKNEVVSLQDAITAKLRSESSESSESKCISIGAANENEFSTCVPEADADVCLVSWKDSGSMTSPNETDRQKELRKKLGFAAKACEGFTDSRDLPKAKFHARVGTDEIVAIFPGGVELTVHPNDVCAFVEYD